MIWKEALSNEGAQVTAQERGKRDAVSLGARPRRAARPALVPRAWDFNGRASVLSAVMAILLAMSLGLNAVVLIAIGLYVVAAATLR
jgi:hypothetical protein